MAVVLSCEKKAASDQDCLSIDRSPISEICRETLQKVQDLFAKCTVFDCFNGCCFDFTSEPSFIDRSELKAVKFCLPQEILKHQDKHVISLRFLPSQARILNYALEVGFTCHSGNSSAFLLTLCLKQHGAVCSFPKFATASIGVTAVVFDPELINVLLIKEKWGGVEKWKPPTGGVDYLDNHEHPINAVARELREETGVEVDPHHAVLIGMSWTQKLRGNFPDVNFAFGFKASHDVQLEKDQDEIAHIGWQPVAQYLDSEAEQESGSYVMEKLIIAAYRAFQHQKEWTPRQYCWNDGKPVTLFCF